MDNVEEICEELVPLPLLSSLPQFSSPHLPSPLLPHRLNEESFLYKKGTKEMNDKLWWRRFKSVVCGVIVVIVILVVVICLAVIVAG